MTLFIARQTYPDIVQYEITEGPHEGLILNAPPNRHAFPAPKSACPYTGRDTTRPGSVKFRLLIHDKAAHDRLFATGALTSPRHTGASGEGPEDYRSTK